MKLIEYGKENNKSLLFLPCEFFPSAAYQKSLDILSKEWHVYQIDFDFQKDSFTSMKDVINQILNLLNKSKSFDFAYGCSFGAYLLSELQEKGIPIANSLLDVFPYFPKMFSSLYIRYLFKNEIEFQNKFPMPICKESDEGFHMLSSIPKTTIQSILNFIKQSEKKSLNRGTQLKYLSKTSKNRNIYTVQTIFDAQPFELLFSKPEELFQRIELVYEIG